MHVYYQDKIQGKHDIKSIDDLKDLFDKIIKDHESRWVYLCITNRFEYKYLYYITNDTKDKYLGIVEKMGNIFNNNNDIQNIKYIVKQIGEFDIWGKYEDKIIKTFTEKINDNFRWIEYIDYKCVKTIIKFLEKHSSNYNNNDTSETRCFINMSMKNKNNELKENSNGKELNKCLKKVDFNIVIYDMFNDIISNINEYEENDINEYCINIINFNRKHKLKINITNFKIIEIILRYCNNIDINGTNGINEIFDVVIGDMIVKKIDDQYIVQYCNCGKNEKIIYKFTMENIIEMVSLDMIKIMNINEFMIFIIDYYKDYNLEIIFPELINIAKKIIRK